MLKIRLICLAILSLSISWGAHAEEKRYISDELDTYVHSGPGNQYRIVGTLKGGDEVTLISVDDSTSYGQIRDSKGKTTWIPLNQLSETPSLRIRVPDLEQQVKTLTDKLANIDNSWNQRTAEMQQKVAASDSVISELQKENESLKNQLVVAQKKVSAVNLQLDDKQRTIILQWFMYGGGVAGIGLLLGLVLPHLIPSRKKNNRWMN
ncbi:MULTISPECIES: TIGR04211 family SH3 domain-containing protein [Yersinia]|jgi:SH3 domain protein|uniref:SH3 domain-containing protein n=1 Tax=Yersinia intermedia TaxID=631 RepID=A0A0T9MHW6_YERIN|nr:MULTISPECIES: TIGR04211 family SH3 domain-containing protein [Yersinia]ARB82681.1 SH3 domain-containing protein [Yersinia sp. FDAARGOS_228]AVL36413.1 SH3 domain-containing protein [Yersinia intermedia]MCW8113756.1 TIGR04211 family SH3 domain-containing protein [Yersinia intermedia]MDA5480918.1 TIGR04211 family SH3 domain-containing protein [Yersinia intermedia]MDA5493402.1 TIGR04211 family SH3 domain-containing protein [Yersinia intermedia]